MEENLYNLGGTGVLKNSRIVEFWERLHESPQKAREYLEDIHHKNPNTGRRRWNPPGQLAEAEAEALYQEAYNFLASLIEQPLEEAYATLKGILPPNVLRRLTTP